MFYCFYFLWSKTVAWIIKLFLLGRYLNSSFKNSVLSDCRLWDSPVLFLVKKVFCLVSALPVTLSSYGDCTWWLLISVVSWGSVRCRAMRRLRNVPILLYISNSRTSCSFGALQALILNAHTWELFESNTHFFLLTLPGVVIFSLFTYSYNNFRLKFLKAKYA